MCKVLVEFIDGQTLELSGQVLYNERKKSWSINAINSQGNQIAIRLKD